MIFLFNARKTSESNVFISFFFTLVLSHCFLCSKPNTMHLYHGFYQVSGALLEWALFCFYSWGCSLFDSSQFIYRISHCQTRWSSCNICGFIFLDASPLGSFDFFLGQHQFLWIFVVRASLNKIIIYRMTVYQCHVLQIHIIWVFISF